MALIALLVEGQTERIFLEYLLPCLQLPDRLFISKKLPDVLKNDIHENKIWLQDCTGDGSFPSYIKKNQRAFITNNFDKILLVRDYYPDNKPPTALCKGELCQNLINNIPGDVTNKYTNNILINLSVEEIEAWFFLDKEIFERIDPDLNEQFINKNFGNILEMNPENIKHPSSKIKSIFQRGGSNFKYRKREDVAYSFINRLIMDNFLYSANEEYAQSFYRFINIMLEAL